MSERGSISVKPRKRFQWIVLALAIQWGATGLLIFWWHHLLSQQAEQIFTLERQNSQLAATAQLNYEATTRMLHAEGIWFFAVIFASGGFLIWMYLRDGRRAKSLQAFFASVTHEFKTPLTSIRLQAESLADVCVEDSYQQSLTGRLLQDVNKLEAQVDRTLELARVEGGGQLLTEKMPLRPLVQKAIESWRHGFSGKLQIETQVDETIVQVDPHAFQIVMRNLLENSLRHGGKPEVQVTIASHTDSGWVELDYHDDGVGAGEEVHHLSNLFAKGRGSSGAGVGLYLVDRLVRRMGGRIEYFNSSGFHAKIALQGAAHV